jgi:hypothetical protein
MGPRFIAWMGSYLIECMLRQFSCPRLDLDDLVLPVYSLHLAYDGSVICIMVPSIVHS